MANNTAHYIDNKEFYQKISDWKAEYNTAISSGDEKPRVTDYLGECFVKIANHLAYKSNFVNYTFRDEMILDGIENCLTYIHNFDPDKSKNPFAYFTQITYYAFIRRIQKENKHNETKLKYLQSIDLQALLDEIDGEDMSDRDYLKWISDHIDTRAREENNMNEKLSKMPKRRPKYFDERPSAELDFAESSEKDKKELDNGV